MNHAGAGFDDNARAHSRRLSELIRQHARASGGLLPFDRFMELALYAPGLGYYVSGARKMGADGDFVTAPEISPFFGRCVASQCAEVLELLGAGDILEFGAGSGALALQVLRALDDAGRLPERYLILELSPDLRERQERLLRVRLPHLRERLIWLDGLPKVFRGVVLANEVIDAMPVHRFRVGADGVPAEIFVRPSGDGWEEVPDAISSVGLKAAVTSLQADGLALEAGYCSEINLRLGPWLSALAGALERALVLLIDYGYTRREYYRAGRTSGTLMCHFRHRAHDDPYRNLGLQDITAHVDFTAASALGKDAGFTLAGYSTQAHFLLGCGLAEMLAKAPGSVSSMDELAGARQLVLPEAMGEGFKVMGLQRGVDARWRGFSVRDLSDSLSR